MMGGNREGSGLWPNCENGKMCPWYVVLIRTQALLLTVTAQ